MLLTKITFSATTLADYTTDLARNVSFTQIEAF